MEGIELPFKTEYAKTGRASCKGCKMNIGKDSLRIAAMVQSAFHDGKQPNWFHESCFFKKQRPGSVGDIENFENLRYEDQEKLKKTISELGAGAVVAAGTGKGKKRSKTESAAVKDFGVEYAKSARAVCKGCEQKILKDEVRIRKTVFDTEVGMKYGGQPLWHHINCFAQLRGELGWMASGENLPGFESLSKEDQKQIKDALPVFKAEDVPDAKKAKHEKKDENEMAEEKKLGEKVKAQTKRLFKFRDCLKNEMKKSDMQSLLEANSQSPVRGDSEKLYDQIADMLTFGALTSCKICKGNQILFQKSGYLCNGNLTEWSKCMNLDREPKRNPVVIPENLKSSYPFLKDVKKKVETRAIQYIAPSISTIAKNMAMKKGDELDGPKVKRERPALYLFEFAHIGLKNMEADLKKRISKLGGTIDTKVTEKTIAVFSTKENVERMNQRMIHVKNLGIHVVPIEYLQAVEDDPSGALRYISSMSLCDWGTDPSARVPQEELKSSKSKSIYTKSIPKSIKLTVKDGLAVDPDSGLDQQAHVYVEGKDKYSVVLALTDIQKNKNSYYKLQLLKSDFGSQFYVFRAWGRIGTTIGGKRVDNYSTLLDAKRNFKESYLDKTGNHFENRNNFEKQDDQLQASTSTIISNAEGRFSNRCNTANTNSSEVLNQDDLQPMSSIVTNNSPVPPSKNEPTVHTVASQSLQTQIDKKLLRLFTDNFHPFRIVEETAFRQFVEALNPSYELPNRHAISRTLIPALYEECVNETRDILKTAVKVCVTTDCWTSVNMESYMAVTVHFLTKNFDLVSLLLECANLPENQTTKNLALKLDRILSEWNVKQKLLMVVSNDADNIKSTVISELGWEHFSCFAHTINLIAIDALKEEEVTRILSKVKHIVRHFKSSFIATARLLAYQRMQGVGNPLKLLQDVSTRWNSTFYMLGRFIQLEETVKSTMVLSNMDTSSYLSADDSMTVRQLLQILKPLETVTKIISGEKYLTASLIIPLANGLEDVYTRLLQTPFINCIKTTVKRIQESICTSLNGLEENRNLSLATYLDPRFKHIAFRDKNNAENAKKIVISLVAEKFSQQQNNSIFVDPMTSNSTSNTDPIFGDIWAEFDKKVALFQAFGNPNSKATAEVEFFVDCDRLKRTEDPLKWWRENKYMFPKLALVAQERLSAVATSVPSERLFSKAGQITSERRSRLSATKAKMLPFLNSNLNVHT